MSFAPASSLAALTLIELLLVIMTIEILDEMLRPELGRTKRGAQGILCMHNARQLYMRTCSAALSVTPAAIIRAGGSMLAAGGQRLAAPFREVVNAKS